MKRIATQVLMALAAIVSLQAAAPQGYYSASEGKKGKALLTSLYSKISSHTNVGYNGLWNVYKSSDVDANGKIWDMYSTKRWNPNGEQCGNYSYVGDCYNREHSLPKSWFDDASPMYSDAFHIYPTDGKVNGQRSNYPYGECSGGTTLPSHGSVRALGRLGRSTFPGYSGTVFEPDDEYKGDFARSYFYMAACYNDRISGWHSDMMGGNDYPVFKTWAVNLLLKWHRQDPVSDKERKRNDAVYNYQHNRNPFIDYPDLAEHIWGDKTDIAWSSTGSVEPAISAPVNGSTVSLGNTAVNVAVSRTVTVKGVNLTSAATVSVSGGSGFSVSPASLAASAVNSDAGAQLTVTCVPESEGTTSATVTVSSGTVSTRFTVTATAYSSLTATEATDVTDEGFTARWVNIDGPGASYDLSVMFNGTPLSGYPVKVSAAAGAYRVTGLSASTTYTYKVSSQTLTSNEVSVTTLAPIPSVAFMFDGDLTFYTTPGTASDVAEVLAEIENIPGDVTVEVVKPFEVSTDRAAWGQSVTLSPGADRFYMRLGATAAGNYRTSLKATAEGYYNDDTDVTGEVAETVSFVETFPNDRGSYANGSYEGAMGEWTFEDAGVWSSDAHLPSGTQPVRLGKTDTSMIEMAFDKTRGAGKVTFTARSWSANEGAATLDIEWSTDGGISWNNAGTVTIPDEKWADYSVPVNQAGSVRVRVAQKSGKRLLLGDLAISDYSLSGLEETLDYHRWDAYCRDGRLVVDVRDGGEALDVRVYDLQGVTRYEGRTATGVALDGLGDGLYIVVVDDFARRVFVK